MKTNVHHDKRCGGGYLGPKWISYLCLCELVSANGDCFVTSAILPIRVFSLWANIMSSGFSSG